MSSITQRDPWEYDLLLKILIVGDSSVGKSCLLLRYADDEFTTAHQATIGVDFRIAVHDVTVNRYGRDHEVRAKMQLWDTAGQERFRAITAGYYRGSHGLLVVYDKTNEQSFLNVKTWMNEIQLHASSNVQVVLVANKSDLVDKCEVDTSRGQELARELGIPFIETSAKDGSGVHEAFKKIVTHVAESFDYLAHDQKPDGIVPDPTTTTNKKTVCC